MSTMINKMSKIKDFSLEIPLITQFDALNQVAASLRYANASSSYGKSYRSNSNYLCFWDF